MRFRTEIKAEKSVIQLESFREVMMIGSCFADNIAARMRQTLWPAYNPFGMLYNPLSIHKILENLLLMPEEDAVTFFEDSVFRTDGMYFSWMFDSRMHGRSREELILKYNDMRHEVREHFSHIDTVFVTFGTAWCYALEEGYDEEFKSLNVVANCHKQPARLFRRFRLTQDEICSYWIYLIDGLHHFYPDLRFVFTVSPVRHLKDGIHENTLSKAILHLAIEQLCRQHKSCCYFPAFELLNDDLRDYRFYATDMAHPSDQAVEYIWEHFQQTFMSDATRQAVAEGEKLYKRLNHRPITGHPDPAFQSETARLLTSFLRKWNLRN